MSELPVSYRKFRDQHVKVWQVFDQLGAAAAEEGPLDKKVRELVKLGMAAANGSESGVHSHTHRALEAGAQPEEIEHAIILGITTIGFPSMMAALTWAKDAIAASKK
ncbi:MAG TPA: carboxymuconolactone decarboxylase family protein [Anaerolineales bacterium]|jgi:AhpD family alkylhydroperoxidase|nr:carboxymuconolactone decarboxylase family protein [Anaerolineales bacterium]